MKIVFATNNQHKLQEIRDILGSDYEVVSLKERKVDFLRIDEDRKFMSRALTSWWEKASTAWSSRWRIRILSSPARGFAS